jgi:hypothetical protein
MNLDNFIDKLIKLKSKYGGNLKVVYSIDDQGTDFRESFCDPEVGDFSENKITSKGKFRQWYDNKEDADYEGFKEDEIAEFINSICIN